jgi:hypothetical protein
MGDHPQRRDTDPVLLDISAGLARVEAKLDSLIGDGQPGRVGRLEDDVDMLKTRVNRAAGFVGALGIAWTVAEFYWHKIVGGR